VTNPGIQGAIETAVTRYPGSSSLDEARVAHGNSRKISGSSLFQVGSRHLKLGHSQVQGSVLAPQPGPRSWQGIGSKLARYRLPAMESARGRKAAPGSLHGVS